MPNQGLQVVQIVGQCSKDDYRKRECCLPLLMGNALVRCYQRVKSVGRGQRKQFAVFNSGPSAISDGNDLVAPYKLPKLLNDAFV